jgi:hypothetical protein
MDGDGIPCAAEHGRACVKCAGSLAVFDSLKLLQVEADRRPGLTPAQMDDLINTNREIAICERHFTQYRAHLAQIRAEAEFDAVELDGLKDDEALIITDYKMKILACFYRENQARFFGKRGCSLLGFLILVNRPGCPGQNGRGLSSESSSCRPVLV